MKIIQISDLHLTLPPKSIWQTHPNGYSPTTEETFLNIKKALKKQKPDLIIATGDLSHQPSHEIYQHLQQHFIDLKTPCYCLPGNHDDIHLMRQSLQQQNIHTQNELELEHWHILFLNTAKPEQVEGYLSKKSLINLEKRLSEINKPILIAMHHQPVLIKSHWMDEIGLENSQAFLKIIEHTPQVKAVIFGHIHQNFDHQQNGIRFLGCPSTYAQFKPKKEKFSLDEQNPGYRILELNANGNLATQVYFV